jgi:hypothetical protein
MERQLLRELAAAARLASRRESKIAALARFLGRVREPVLVFTEFRDTLIHLRDSLACRVAVLHGGLDRDERSVRNHASRRTCLRRRRCSMFQTSSWTECAKQRESARHAVARSTRTPRTARSSGASLHGSQVLIGELHARRLRARRCSSLKQRWTTPSASSPNRCWCPSCARLKLRRPHFIAPAHPAAVRWPQEWSVPFRRGARRRGAHTSRSRPGASHVKGRLPGRVRKNQRLSNQGCSIVGSRAGAGVSLPHVVSSATNEPHASTGSRSRRSLFNRTRGYCWPSRPSDAARLRRSPHFGVVSRPAGPRRRRDRRGRREGTTGTHRLAQEDRRPRPGFERASHA